MRRLLVAMLIVAGGIACESVHPAAGAHAQTRAAAPADLHRVHVTLREGAITLKDVFSAVELQTPFTFVYMKADMPLESIAITDGREYALDALLEECTRRLGIVFARVNDHLVVRRASAVRPETVTLSGTVRDASTNEPLVFANVVIEGTLQGAVTDAVGRYIIALAPGSCSVRCGFVGFRPAVMQVTLTGDAELNIALTPTDVVLQDVTVFAHRIEDGGQPEVNALTLQSETIKHVTSLIPDVMRSVQMLPGVSTNNEFSSKFNVRGGNQDENLVVVNGTEVYDPFHLKEVSNASIGIFNADMIRKMDLITGGFPARYGDKMSSVLNIEYREGSRDAYKGMASVSLLDLNALVEGPIGERASFIIGARKSYLEYILSLLGEGPYIHPMFYDVQGVASYAPTPASRFMLKLIHSGDEFHEDPHRNFQPTLHWPGRDNAGTLYAQTQDQNDSVNNRAAYYSNMAALQHTQILSSDAVIRTEVSLYDQREDENYLREYLYDYVAASPKTNYFYHSLTQYVHSNVLRIRTLDANAALDLQIAPAYGIKTGAGYQRITYDQELLEQQSIDEFTNEYQFPDTSITHRVFNVSDEVNEGINARSYKFAGYMEHVVQVTDRLLINAGGRVDYFDLNKDLTWSPRLNLAYTAAGGLVFRAAWGHFYQSPVYRQIASSVASDTNTQSQHAVHVVLGVDYELALDRSAQNFLRFKLEGYHKRYDNLITASMTSQGVVLYSRKNDATGKADGMDMQITYSAPGFYGWVSYGYLMARQTSVLKGIVTTFPRYTDQRHTLAVTGEVDLGKAWSINSRFVYGSGYPFTPLRAQINPATHVWEWVSNPAPNSEYLPSYSRVDLKIAKDFGFFGTTTSMFIDVSNLFNSTNIQSFSYKFNSQGQPYREEVKLWPILPTFGLAVRF